MDGETCGAVSKYRCLRGKSFRCPSEGKTGSTWWMSSGGVKPCSWCMSSKGTGRWPASKQWVMAVGALNEEDSSIEGGICCEEGRKLLRIKSDPTTVVCRRRIVADSWRLSRQYLHGKHSLGDVFRGGFQRTG